MNENGTDRKLTLFIVDDDTQVVDVLSRFLSAKNHVVYGCTSSTEALGEIVDKQPDCVVLDLMMPRLDGIELLKQIKKEPRLKETKIVILSGKAYEFDRDRAFSFGADGFMTKPVKSARLADTIERIVADRMELCCWGVHGTLPVPGKHTCRYGGNTSCVSLSFPKDQLLIFDAGTGIKALARHLTAANRALVGAKIFISHPHWDHINALPFFEPLFVPGNEIEICGPAHGDITMGELISGQMDGVYFPIKIKEFGATVSFRDLTEEQIAVGDVTIRTMLLNHPGNCLGYRVEYKDRSICYVTDNELYPESSSLYNTHYVDKLADFVNGTDVLITDCTYSDTEYGGKIGWGHSSVTPVVDLADRAQVKSLHLFHHDPDHTDADIDALLAAAQSILTRKRSKTRCVAPKEQQCFKV